MCEWTVTISSESPLLSLVNPCLTPILLFFCRYETSNGNKRTEEASLKNAGTENEALVVKGSFSYTAPDGQVITVNYVADENGYQPDNVPKA
jgi:Insect cuticle protein